MTLNEQLSAQRLGEESIKYHWAISELGFKPNLEHVQEIMKVSDNKNVPYLTMLALVTGESSWNDKNTSYNQGSNDYGLFQLNNIWHNQHRSNINAHIRTGIEHYKWCLDTENGNERNALGRYNTGQRNNSIGRRYAAYILGYKSKIQTKASQHRVRL